MNRIKILLFNLFLVFLPTQLAYHYWPYFSFIYGIRVDYLAIAVYVTDILILLNILYAVFVSKIKFIFPKKITIFLLCFILINIFFSISPWVSLIKWLRVVALFVFGLYVSQNRKLFLSKNALDTMFIGISIVSFLGILQFIKGSTLGGFWYFLGERTFNTQTPGIALQDFFGQLKLRAYATFPHPNSLSGYLVLTSIFLLMKRYKIDNFYKKISSIFIVTCFLLTNSLSAFSGVIVVIVVNLFKKVDVLKIIKFFIILGVISSIVLTKYLNIKFLPIEIGERLALIDFSLTIIKDNFFIGTGLNTFIVNSYRYLVLSQGNFSLQPVHNIFILLLSEVGILGLISVYVFISNLKIKIENNRYLLLGMLFISTTGMFDHYWLTLQQNLLLVILFIFSMTKITLNDKIKR